MKSAPANTADTRTTTSILTGIALIVLPLLALGLKLFSFGWIMVVIIFGPSVVLAIGYIIQIIIASQVFLGSRGSRWAGPARRRVTIAAWVTSIAVVVIGIFLPDGGDTRYGSTFQVWLGSESAPNPEAIHAATDALTAGLTWVAVVVWLAAFLWLALEWLIGVAPRNPERSAARKTAAR